jgi:hypothetical protein
LLGWLWGPYLLKKMAPKYEDKFELWINQINLNSYNRDLTHECPVLGKPKKLKYNSQEESRRN